MIRWFAGLRRIAAISIALAVAAAGTTAFGDQPTIGFIYVGPKDDYGYDQAHHEGAEAVKAIGLCGLLTPR